ncbi:Retrovirus-related Pol polyprotein from transposon 297, partial [Eumeta japonica]
MDKFQLRDEKSSNYIDAIISLRNQLRQPLPDYQHRSRYKISYRGVNKISYEDAGEQDDVIEEIRYNRHVNKPISTQEEGDDKDERDTGELAFGPDDRVGSDSNNIITTIKKSALDDKDEEKCRQANNIDFTNENIETQANQEQLDQTLHKLTTEQQQALNEAKGHFLDFELHGLGKMWMEEHAIETANAAPIKRHYSISPAKEALIYADGVRNRRLNEQTVKDAYPLIYIDALLGRLQDTYFISSIDLKDAFWQILLAEDSKPKMAFTVPGRPHYHVTVMPFGLCNAAQRLCRLVDRVIPAHLRHQVFVYLGDLLVVSPDFESHMSLLRKVGDLLSYANLTINLKKTKFCQRELRYIVGEGKLKADPDKIEGIMKIPIIKCTRDVRSFLGLTSWFRRFIKDYSSLTAPITKTLRKSKICNFDAEAIDAFNDLKTALTVAPVLTHPSFDKRFYVQCDASNLGVGAILFQLDAEGLERPIAFHSAQLNSAQRNYSLTERECLAVISAILKFRPFIELMPFTVLVDHSALKWLMNQKELSGCLTRWSLKLQSYQFDIQHRKGSQNVVADTLSRLHTDEINMFIDEQHLIDLDSPEFQNKQYTELKENIRENADRFLTLKFKTRLFIRKHCILMELIFMKTLYGNSGYKLGHLEDSEVDIISKNQALELVRRRIKENIHVSYEKTAKRSTFDRESQDRESQGRSSSHVGALLPASRSSKLRQVYVARPVDNSLIVETDVDTWQVKIDEEESILSVWRGLSESSLDKMNDGWPNERTFVHLHCNSGTRRTNVK